MSWDPERLAKRFSSEATRAELRMRECEQKAKAGRSPAQYNEWRDEAHAEFMFAYRFADQGRTQSPDVLLEWLTNFEPEEMASGALDKDVFVRTMKRLVQSWKDIAQRELAEREKSAPRS